MFLQIAELLPEIILIKLQVVFGIFFAILNATAGVQFSFHISYKVFCCISLAFLHALHVISLSSHFTFSSLPSPFEFNGSESHLETAVVMRFLKPPIISRRVSSINPELRLSPLFVLFQWNAIGTKEDCSSDIQLFWFFFPPFLLFLWQNYVLIYTSFWMIKARGLQWIQVYLSHGSSGNYFEAATTHWSSCQLWNLCL